MRDRCYVSHLREITVKSEHGDHLVTLFVVVKHMAAQRERERERERGRERIKPLNRSHRSGLSIVPVVDVLHTI